MIIKNFGNFLIETDGNIINFIGSIDIMEYTLEISNFFSTHMKYLENEESTILDLTRVIFINSTGVKILINICLQSLHKEIVLKVNLKENPWQQTIMRSLVFLNDNIKLVEI